MEYLKSAVTTASPEQLQLMLVDGAIRFTRQGIDAISEKDIEKSFNAFDRAQRIVLELHNGLQHDANPSIVQQMAALYNFIYTRLVDASVKREAVPAEEALRILEDHRETWVALIEKLQKDGLSSPRRPGVPSVAGESSADQSDAAASPTPTTSPVRPPTTAFEHHTDTNGASILSIEG
jgi:flagellar protein FliS